MTLDVARMVRLFTEAGAECLVVEQDDSGDRCLVEVTCAERPLHAAIVEFERVSPEHRVLYVDIFPRKLARETRAGERRFGGFSGQTYRHQLDGAPEGEADEVSSFVLRALRG